MPRIFFYARRLSTIAGTRPKYTRQDLRRVRGINGEQRQDWNTNDMIFNCRQLITFASRMMTIKPGDILFTGTPHGVIFGKPKGEQVWLKPGDRVVCSVEKLGELAFSLA